MQFINIFNPQWAGDVVPKYVVPKLRPKLWTRGWRRLRPIAATAAAMAMGAAAAEVCGSETVGTEGSSVDKGDEGALAAICGAAMQAQDGTAPVFCTENASR